MAIVAGAGLEGWVVVTREAIAEAVTFPEEAQMVINPRPEAGQAGSLTLGVAWVREHYPGARGALVFLGDMPLVEPETIEGIVETLEAHPEAIVVPEYGGRPGHPVGFGSRWFGEFGGQHGDVGGRKVITAHPEAVRRIAGGPGCVWDLDTPEDWKELAGMEEGKCCDADNSHRQ